MPNSGMMEEKGLRQQWDDALFEWITQLEETKPVIWGGDLKYVLCVISGTPLTRK